MLGVGIFMTLFPTQIAREVLEASKLMVEFGSFEGGVKDAGVGWSVGEDVIWWIRIG